MKGNFVLAKLILICYDVQGLTVSKKEFRIFHTRKSPHFPLKPQVFLMHIQILKYGFPRLVCLELNLESI